MKKIIALSLALVLAMSFFTALADTELVSGARNVFEYVGNFSRRVLMLNADYGTEIAPTFGFYMSWPDVLLPDGYKKVFTPYGNLTFNSEDYSLVKCEYTVMRVKNGTIEEDNELALKGIVNYCALEFSDTYDSIYEIEKKYLDETMFSKSIDAASALLSTENTAKLVLQGEDKCSVLVSSGEYNYYLAYYKYTDSNKDVIEEYSIVAIAPGYKDLY